MIIHIDSFLGIDLHLMREELKIRSMIQVSSRLVKRFVEDECELIYIDIKI